MQPHSFIHDAHAAVWPETSAAVQIQYAGRNLYDCGSSQVKYASDLPVGSCSFVPNGAAVQESLHLDRNPNEAPWEAAVLCALFLVMRGLCYIALRIKTRSRVR